MEKLISKNPISKGILPKGWLKVSLEDSIEFVIGGDWGKDENFNDPDYDFAYCIRGSEIKNWNENKGSTAALRKIKKSNIGKRKLIDGDILVEISGGGPDQPVGRTVLVDKSVLAHKPEIPKICTNFLRLLRPKNHFNSKFLNLYLTHFYYSGEIVKYQGGSNNLRNLKFPDYSKIELPLPPKSEQDAIVSKIEELFSELDKGKQQLETARQQLKVYRQAVLKWAFEGRLTNKNVKEGELPDLWRWATIGELFEVFVGATPSRQVRMYWQGDINWVSSGEVRFCSIRETKEKITQLGLSNSSCRVHPEGTVIIAMIGEGKTRGQAAILKVAATHNQNTAAIRVAKPHLSEILYYFLQLNYEENRKIGSGNNQKALNKERVKNIKYPVIPFQEQVRILDAIEGRLSVCNKMEETIITSLAQAEALRQSILKRAFEGRLIN